MVCAEACALEQYFLHPSKKEPAEIALAYETMGDCPNRDGLAQKYSKELENSQTSLRRIREKDR